jgi:hypothetical protein
MSFVKSSPWFCSTTLSRNIEIALLIGDREAQQSNKTASNLEAKARTGESLFVWLCIVCSLGEFHGAQC